MNKHITVKEIKETANGITLEDVLATVKMEELRKQVGRVTGSMGQLTQSMFSWPLCPCTERRCGDNCGTPCQF